MPSSIPERKQIGRAGLRPDREIPYGAGSVRYRNGYWEARWVEHGARPSRQFHHRDEAEDFLRVMFRAKGRLTHDERRRPYDENIVYFIRGVRGGPIKIGHAANPVERLRAMQAGSPVKLQIIAIIEGGVRREAELHRQFAYLHAHNEWFRSSKELLQWIRENAVRIDPVDGSVASVDVCSGE